AAYGDSWPTALGSRFSRCSAASPGRQAKISIKISTKISNKTSCKRPARGHHETTRPLALRHRLPRPPDGAGNIRHHWTAQHVREIQHGPGHERGGETRRA